MRFKKFIIVVDEQCANSELADLFEQLPEVIIFRGHFFETFFAGLARFPLIGFNTDRFMALDSQPADVYKVFNECSKSIFVQPPSINIDDLIEKVPYLATLTKKRFYCLHSRTSDFDRATNNQNFFSHKNRNTDFKQYFQIMKFLANNDIASVRLSEANSAKLKHQKIDKNYFFDVCEMGLDQNEMKRLHLWLTKNCEGFIGCSSGIVQLANLFEKPVLIINGYPASFCFPHKKNGMGVPKQVLCVRNGSPYYLSVSDLLSNDYAWIRNDQVLERNGLKLELQSNQVIFESFLEFFHRIEQNNWEFKPQQLLKTVRGDTSYGLHAVSGFSESYIHENAKNASSSIKDFVT